MIEVPSSWKCSTELCVCVEVNRSFLVCHVVPSPTARTRYRFEGSVQVPTQQARVLLRDNTAFSEEKHVYWHGSSSDDGVRHFAIASNATEESEVLCLHVLNPIYCATSVTLCGYCPSNTRSALGFLSAELTGRFVSIGARVQTSLGAYTVRDMSLRDGHRGVALVSGESRIRLNSVMESTSGAVTSISPTCPVGLDEPAEQLMRIMKFTQSQPGLVCGVVVRGPAGCGVRTTVEYCLSQCTSSRGAVFEWSPATVLEVTVPSRLAVLLVTEASRYWPVDEPDTAKLAVRRLGSDAARLSRPRNGLRSSVIAIAISHDYGTACAKPVMETFFSTHVVISLPDLDQRAAILASRRGGSSSEWVQEAQTLVGKTRNDVRMAADSPSWKYTPPFKTVRWEEIGGLPNVKDRLYRALLWPQKHPEQLHRFGISAPKGILLYGPPGCAKTTLVKALCSEGQFSFIYLDSASVLSAFVGESEQLIRDVFARAAQQAPCIVFFDEVEVIGGRRSAGRHDSEQTRLLSTLLTEMDGFTASRGVCFIGATNVPQMIDDALLRPGRFDYLVYVPLPTLDDRKSILSLHLTQTSVNIDSLAEATDGFSGADLKSLCSSALLRLLQAAKQVPETLQDEELMTDYMLSQAAIFPRTEYDMSQITDFHSSHSQDA